MHAAPAMTGVQAKMRNNYPEPTLSQASYHAAEEARNCKNHPIQRNRSAGARGCNKISASGGGTGGVAGTYPVVSGDTLKTGYVSRVMDAQSSRTRLGDIMTEDTADNTTGSAGVV